MFRARHFNIAKSQVILRQLFVKSKINVFDKKLIKYANKAFANQVVLFSKSTVNKNGSTNEGDKKSQSDNNDPLKNLPNNPMGQVMFFIGISITFLVYAQILKSLEEDQRKTKFISWTEFVHQMLEKGEVKSILVNRDQQVAIIELHPGAVINGQIDTSKFLLKINVDDFENRLNKVEDELKIKSEHRISVKYVSTERTTQLLSLLLFAAVVYFIFKRIKIDVDFKSPTDMFSQFRKATYTKVDPKLNTNIPNINFKDVAGLKEAKVEVMEFVQYLKEPERFKKLGAKVPKGALLLGPPGCGKTLLAKALAAECNVPFYSMAGTEFIEVIGGVGAARVRDLFADARKHAPSIIYIDEIDAIGKKRSEGSGQSNDEVDQTLNMLLSEMDGLETRTNVIVLGSTNRPDILDKALLRPGRFDRHITIDLPTAIERKEILYVHLRKLTLHKNVDDNFITDLAQLTVRMSGADLANVCNEAALHAARDAKTEIERKDFEVALERVNSGAEKKSSSIIKKEQKVIAYQECGHLLLSWLLGSTDLMYKVSLVPRTKAVSSVQYLLQDKKLHTKEELFEKMMVHFGGQVAESIVFNSHSTNTEKDLKLITDLAYAQVQSLGMSDAIGLLSFVSRKDELNSTGSSGKRPFSKNLQRLIDEEVGRLVQSAHKQAEVILKANTDKLHKLASALILKETLNYEEIVNIIGNPENLKRYSFQSHGN